MMKVYYASLTGNVRRFVDKLDDVEAVDIWDQFGHITEPYILITYTIDYGRVPDEVIRFLEENSAYCAAVAVSGDMIWGNYYGMAGDTISRELNIPLIMKFEKGGTSADVEAFNQFTKGMV